MNQSDKDQGVSDSVEGLKKPVFKSNEVSFVKEQSPEHQHLVFPSSMNTISGLIPGSKASVDGKEQHKCVLERPSTEDDSSASVIPLTEDVSLASVLHADACVSGEEASGALIKSQSPLFKKLQYKTSSHEDEMTILYADVGCENISAKEEVFMPSSESGSIQPIDPLSRKPNISQDSLETQLLTFKDDIDAGSGGQSDRLRKQSTEKCLSSKKVDHESDSAGVNLSDSEAAITGVVVQQAPQEELGVQLKENEICRQPLETLPSEVLPVQLKVVSEAQHLTGVVSQNEPSSLPNNVQPPQTNIPSSQSSLVDVSVLSTQLISQPFCGHPSNPYPIPTSMSQTQVHQVTATSSFPLQNVAPQPTDSKEFHNFPPSGFHFYASSLPRPLLFLKMLMRHTCNATYRKHSWSASPNGEASSISGSISGPRFSIPSSTTTDLGDFPPASNSAFQNPAFHLQFLQQPMQPGNEFFRPVMRPYSHEVPYNNMSQLSVAGASKLHHNPYASTFEQTPGNSRFSSVLRQDMKPNYRSNNDSLGSNASITSGQGIGAFDSKLTDLPLDSSRSGGQVLGNENLPLFESVESSSTTLGKLGNMSPGDGEFGDPAIDAEVGAVENGSPHLAEEGNWSPENPADAGNTASGDDEIGQDPRSMKHFRAALADFVKEVLKPSWRQGNMSKEAFKTIVKKTVDKVSGAMKKHQIPKSQAKINQYVESSQRKLTKLVTGLRCFDHLLRSSIKVLKCLKKTCGLR
ncbi:hypothetical protein MKX03_018164, partial [Papaver bracteatum]